MIQSAGIVSANDNKYKSFTSLIGDTAGFLYQHKNNTNSSILMYQEHLSLQYTFSALVFEPRLYIPLSILCTHIPFSQRYKHTLKTLPSKYSSYLFILFNFSSKELFLRATCIFHLAYTQILLTTVERYEVAFSRKRQIQAIIAIETSRLKISCILLINLDLHNYIQVHMYII